MAILRAETFTERMIRVAGWSVGRRRRRAELARRRTESLLRVREALGYLNRLGSLKDVPALLQPVEAGCEIELSLEERAVLAQVDGRSSYSQILATSPFTKPDTCRVLSQLLDRGWIRSIKSPHAGPSEIRPRLAADAAAPDLRADVAPQGSAVRARREARRVGALSDVATAPAKFLVILRVPRPIKAN